ncbi:hypothetical protein ACFYY8_13020 [Streptosporangium sp. NPDC001559]|uniref:hypothetical protein n=1 Tax=Streptosporangium sp. NPDC001559 TaxID=3366187 RepID=UPI0036EE4C9A
MRHVMSTVTGALAVGAALIVAAPGFASAATGTFEYSSRGISRTLDNPNDRQCYDLGDAVGAENDTDRVAVLYTGRGCRGTAVARVVPGGSAVRVRYASVIFES